MAVTIPAGFPIVGSNEPGGQVAQYLPGRPIGGGAGDPPDGQDEATDAMQGITHTWARGRLSTVTVVHTFGQGSPAEIVAYSGVGVSAGLLWLPGYLNAARVDVDVSLDWADGEVTVEVFDSTTLVLITSGVSGVTAAQTQGVITLLGLPQDVFFVARLEKNVTECRLYGIRVVERPSTP